MKCIYTWYDSDVEKIMRHHDFPIGNTYSSLKIINNFKSNINFEDELKSVCFEKSEVFHLEFRILTSPESQPSY